MLKVLRHRKISIKKSTSQLSSYIGPFCMNYVLLNCRFLYRDTLHTADESEETYLSTFNIPLENPEVPNWNVLIRVFQPTEQEEEGT